MKPKLLAFAACFMLITCSAFAQQFEVLANFDPQTKDDYAKYEKDVVAATSWHEATPVGTDADKRTQTSAFLMKWITGSPTVSVSLNADFILKLSNKSAELMMMFMAAYTRNALQNNYDTSQVNGYIAGVKGMINLYKLGGKLKKNKTMEEAVQANAEVKLDEWVKTHMKDAK